MKAKNVLTLSLIAKIWDTLTDPHASLDRVASVENGDVINDRRYTFHGHEQTPAFCVLDRETLHVVAECDGLAEAIEVTSALNKEPADRQQISDIIERARFRTKCLLGPEGLGINLFDGNKSHGRSLCCFPTWALAAEYCDMLPKDWLSDMSYQCRFEGTWLLAPPEWAERLPKSMFCPKAIALLNSHER